MEGKRMDGGCTNRGMDGWMERNGDADAKHSALFFLLGHALVRNCDPHRGM